MNNVHDKLFKQMMSLKSEAIALASSFLPQDVIEEIDLDSFELSNVSFITEQLKEYFADVIYTCNTKKNKKVKISFLLEHKSYYDPHLPLQLLNYLFQGYDYQYVKEGKKELSLIIPVLIYHEDSKWKKREIKNMIPLSNPVFERYIPNFVYDVIDLVSITDEYLKSMAVGHLLPTTFLLFKHKGDSEYFLENIKEILIFVKRTITEEERNLFIESVRNYINGFFDVPNQYKMTYDNTIREIIDNKLYVPGSSIDRWLKEGRAEGKIEGKIVTSRAKDLIISLSLLKNLSDLSTAKISTFAKVEEKFVIKIKKIITENTAAKSKKMILKQFFKDIELDEELKKEVFAEVDNYFKKEKSS